MDAVMVGVTVAPNLTYCWNEVMQHLSLLRYPPQHLCMHLVSHAEPEAKAAWDAWGQQQPFSVSSELFTDLRPGHRSGGGGYNPETAAVIMAVLEHVRQAFLRTDCKWLLLVECDQLVPPNLLKKLMARDLPIVMAATPARHRPSHMNCAFGEGNRLHLEPIRELSREGLIPCASVGIGCTLLKREVLEAVGWENPQELVKKYGGNGPDVAICLQATEVLGVQPCVDMDVRALHVDNRHGGNVYLLC